MSPPPPARFRVDSTFTLRARSLFVLAGSILVGTVRAGMLVRIPLNSSVTLSIPVHSVEFMDGPGRVSQAALCLRYEEDLELAIWEGLNLGDGEELRLSEAEEPAEVVPPAPQVRRRPWWRFW